MMELPLNITFKGKVVVVTGAGGVLCGTMAKAFAQAGAKAFDQAAYGVGGWFFRFSESLSVCRSWNLSLHERKTESSFYPVTR